MGHLCADFNTATVSLSAAYPRHKSDLPGSAKWNHPPRTTADFSCRTAFVTVLKPPRDLLDPPTTSLCFSCDFADRTRSV